MIWYVLIFLIACILNYRHKEALLLTLIVGLGAFSPIPERFGEIAWYSICASIEITIFLFAINLRTIASYPIAALSVLFIFVHYLGWKFHGYIIGSPYHLFARTLEFTEISSCAVLSNPIINFVKERMK